MSLVIPEKWTKSTPESDVISAKRNGLGSFCADGGGAGLDAPASRSPAMFKVSEALAGEFTPFWVFASGSLELESRFAPVDDEASVFEANRSPVDPPQPASCRISPMVPIRIPREKESEINGRRLMLDSEVAGQGREIRNRLKLTPFASFYKRRIGWGKFHGRISL